MTLFICHFDFLKQKNIHMLNRIENRKREFVKEITTLPKAIK